MATYELHDKGITYSNIKQVSTVTGSTISAGKYQVDENGQLIPPKNKIVNAIDINWNNAQIPGIEDPISSTSDVLNLLGEHNKSLSNITNNSSKESASIIIGENGNWWINGTDTGITASGENGLTPYIKDGYWWIGNTQICVIESSQNGFTPYIGSNGNWWINDSDTGVSAIGIPGNTPYIGEDGYWYVNGERTEIQFGGNNGEPGSDGQTPYIKNGTWWIGDTDTGVIATGKVNVSSLITIGDNGNLYINGEDTGIAAYKTIYNGGDGNSIPVYDAETEDRLRNEGNLPNKYISLNDTHKLPSNASLINNLVSVISQLQAEVTKIKNTFARGIYSYNNEATYMSKAVNNYGDIDSEEPLWAIDEAELIPVDDIDFDYETDKIYTDSKLAELNENRIILYFIADSTNVNISMHALGNNSNNFSFNLSNYIKYGKCNVMLIISRTSTDKIYPKNFIYFVISDYETNYTKFKGYLTPTLDISETEVSLNDKYYISKIDFSNAGSLYKFNLYADDKVLGSEVIESIPDEEEGSYRVAHIAVRSCKNYSVIEKISKQLVNNELIFDENTEKLYIKAKGKIINIGAGINGESTDNPFINPDNDNMTNQEILKALVDQGIITVKFKDPNEEGIDDLYNVSNIESYELNNIGSVTFIHEETGKKFEFKTNSEGQLESKLIDESTSFESIIKSRNISLREDWSSVKGFIAQINEGMDRVKKGSGDYKLFADRIRIGAIYAPLSTDVIYGCSHGYIELENSSDQDFNLSGCGLHYIKYDKTAGDNGCYVKYTIKLTGIIKAGSTYLIRCKKYITNDNDSNCYIHVNTYDQEWYNNGELLDLSIDDETTAYMYILSYLNLSASDNLYKLSLDNIDYSLKEYSSYFGNNTSGNTGTLKLIDTSKKGNNDEGDTKASYTLAKGLIDAIGLNDKCSRYGIKENGFHTLRSNVIYKNTFELDPAKQAYNGFGSADSSRVRWANSATDLQQVSLNNEYIEFPKSEEKRPVAYYTPKASYENKNVCTDKTKFDHEKPNAVTVGFGENIYTTRCFNWVSGSYNDEYVWIYDGDKCIGRFMSYKFTDKDIQQSTSYPRRKEYPKDVNNIVYCDYRTNETIDRSRSSESGEDINVSYEKFTMYADRCCGLFAATNDFYVSHKCVIEFALVTGDAKEFQYIVGQSDKNGNPILEHCSDKQILTIYPETYSPKIYQISDQQGFHWIEYQVWAAVANKMNEKIENDTWNHDDNGNRTTRKLIIPIIINTGDLTQSGSRINEWLDYFNAGKSLFNHLEQNNIVGNNDLNGTDVQFLGTGNDEGKSNGYYFYLFNCVDVNNFFTDGDVNHYPIVNKVYIPSLYFLDSKYLRIVCINSEITKVNCRDWYNLKYNGSDVNIYTGFTLANNVGNEIYVANKTPTEGASYDKFTPIYTLLWHAFNDTTKKSMAVCHEMPFTVITHACIAENKTQIQRYRSESNAGTSTLIGSHLNQLTADEQGTGIYWFSRLLESSGVKLCIGGHKHTYAITYPLRENYKYTIEYNKSTNSYTTVNKASLTDGPMSMGPTLEAEKGNVNWIWKPDATYINKESISNDKWRKSEYPWFGKNEGGKYYTDDINWSKFPITYRGNNFIPRMETELNEKFYPVTPKYEGNITYQYSSEQVSSYNASLEGAWTTSTEKVKGSGEHYTQAECDTHNATLPGALQFGQVYNKELFDNEKYDAYANRAVRYVMCQASGYKLKSNKELPTPYQKFSNIIPKTTAGTDSDKPSNHQLYPMFIMYNFNNESNLICDVQLCRVANIFSNKYEFTQFLNSDINTPMRLDYLIDKSMYNDIKVDGEYKISFAGDDPDTVKLNITAYDNYGLWTPIEHNLFPQMTL